MDQDFFEDTIADDFFGLSGGFDDDLDLSDLMDILEPDYLENNILLDEDGSIAQLLGTTEEDLAAFAELEASTKQAEAAAANARAGRRTVVEDSQSFGGSLSALLDNNLPEAEEGEAHEAVDAAAATRPEDAFESLSDFDLERDLREAAALAAGLDLPEEPLEPPPARTQTQSTPRPAPRQESPAQRQENPAPRQESPALRQETPAPPPSRREAPTPSAAPQRDAAPGALARASGERLSSRQLKRHFAAGDMLEAALKLQTVLKLPAIPPVVFLGRAAERALEQLGDHERVIISELKDDRFAGRYEVPRQESFRRVLLASNEAPAGASDEPDPSCLYVADISDLELDELLLPLEGTHLLLTRLAPDASGGTQGTLTLIGNVGLAAGAAFLKSVKEHLESPITLMV